MNFPHELPEGYRAARRRHIEAFYDRLWAGVFSARYAEMMRLGVHPSKATDQAAEEADQVVARITSRRRRQAEERARERAEGTS